MTDQSNANRDASLSRRHVIAGLATATALAAPGLATTPVRAQSAPGTVLITGSNRGIGLELARVYASGDWKVIATCRHPDDAAELQAIAAERSNLAIEPLDVLDHGMIDALAKKLRDQPIDVLLNNAAITGPYDEQAFPNLNFDLFASVMATNVNGPLKMAAAFLDHVAASAQKKIVAITSTQGSITSLRETSLIYYKSSKAALNMAMSVVAKQVKGKGITVGLVSPGMVDTDMMRQLPVKLPLMPAPESAAMVKTVIDGLTIETTGKFLSHRSEEEPW